MVSARQEALNYGERVVASVSIQPPSTAAEWLLRRANEYGTAARVCHREGNTDDFAFLSSIAADLRECAAAVGAIGGGQ